MSDLADRVGTSVGAHAVDGAQDYDSAYRRTYRALRISESHGHVRRTYQARLRLPFGWGQAESAGYGQHD